MGNLRGFRISYAGKGCRRKIVCREKATPIVNWIKLNFQPAELSRVHFLGTHGTAEAVPFPISPRAAVYEVTAKCIGPFGGLRAGSSSGVARVSRGSPSFIGFSRCPVPM